LVRRVQSWADKRLPLNAKFFWGSRTYCPIVFGAPIMVAIPLV
jgi:hypothetical protein